jgi:hypothetical protein
MRITGVETFVLSNRRALVKVSTDDDLNGWENLSAQPDPSHAGSFAEW